MAFSLRSLKLLLVAAVGVGVNGFEQSQPFVQQQQRQQQRHRRRYNTNGALEMASEGNENNNENDPSGAARRMSRRSAIRTAATTAVTASLVRIATPGPASAAKPNGLILNTAPDSGLRWADAKIGSGSTATIGSTCSIDYSMASTAGRFPSIYSTKNGDAPYRWVLGDGSTIEGIELAILGSETDNIPPMLPGGIRRVIVPSNLGYDALRLQQSNKKCLAGNEGSIGPIPPKDAPDGAYQRWYQFYCNPRIPYQPDLVLDIKLYGKRT